MIDSRSQHGGATTCASGPVKWPLAPTVCKPSLATPVVGCREAQDGALALLLEYGVRGRLGQF